MIIVNRAEPISDELLVALLDDALSADDAVYVQTALNLDAGLRARRDRLAEGQAPFAEAFASLLATSPSQIGRERLAAVEIASQRIGSPAEGWFNRRSFAVALVATAVLGPLGIMLGRTMRPDMNNWREAVAQYHRLYSDKTLAGIGANELGQTTEIARVGQELGLNLSLDWLKGVDAQFRRAQILAVDSAPLAQIVLASPEGKALAYCIRPLHEPATEPSLETRAGLSVAHWNIGGFGFLLVGHVDGDRVLDLARTLHRNASQKMAKPNPVT